MKTWNIGDVVRFIADGSIGKLNRKERPSMMDKDWRVCGFDHNGGLLIDLESMDGVYKQGAFIPLRLEVVK